MQKKKKKSKKKKILIFLIIIVLILISFFAYKYFTSNNKDEDTVKVIKSISKYDYNLNDNETDLYKKKFSELDKILSSKKIDYESYAKKISELFIIDFYTLSNKNSKNDIGGVDFVMPSIKDNFVEQARSTFYRYIESDSSRSQKLPEVSAINSVTLENIEFDIKDNSETTTTSKSKNRYTTTEAKKTVEAYKVTISWEYKKDYGYENEAKMILTKEGKKLYIIEMD